MQCECWVWMAVRHLKDRVLHIISWISFDMGLKPTGCRPVNLFFYNMIKHRPDVSVQHLVCFTVSLWWHERRVKRKRDIYCFNDNNHGCELCRLVHLLMFWVDISLSFISCHYEWVSCCRWPCSSVSMCVKAWVLVCVCISFWLSNRAQDIRCFWCE